MLMEPFLAAGGGTGDPISTGQTRRCARSRENSDGVPEPYLLTYKPRRDAGGWPPSTWPEGRKESTGGAATCAEPSAFIS